MAVKPPRLIKSPFQFPRVMLAPVAGVTDRATREIARSKGCPLTFSELISARGLREENDGTWKMLRECRGEHPLAVQLFGNEPDSIAEATRMVSDSGVEAINLNLGCPVKKVFKNKSGCGLTVFPTELVYVLRAMRRATDGHLSVKIRAGVNHKSLNYRLIGDIAQGEGCDAIIFHARTRLMGFGGEAQWDWIQDLKEYLDIPVIGNGDVVDAHSARRLLEQVSALREAELAELRRSGKFDPAAVEQLDQSLARFQAKLLHGPLSALKEASREGDGATAAEWVERLFRLPPPSEGDQERIAGSEQRGAKNE